MRALFIGLLLTAAAFAQKEAPPEGTAPKPYKVPKTTDFTLPNGLKVTLTPYGLVPKVAATLVIRGGGVTEPRGKSGVAALSGALMKEGTESRSAEKFAQETARLGGDISINSGSDEISIDGNALSDSTAGLLALMADIASHPKLPENEVARLKNDQLRALAIRRTSAQTQANEAFHLAIYGDTAYGHNLPKDDEVKSLTLDDVKAFYKAHFVASNAHLYVAGVFPASTREAITKAFGPWEKGAPVQPPAISGAVNHTLVFVDRPHAPQSTIFLGLPVAPPKSPDTIPLEVTDSLLGGSFMSRVTSNIREQKGYTYSPRSFVEFRLGNGLWAERADVTAEHTGDSIKEIMGEIGKLRKEAPPAPELKGIQNSLAGGFVLQNSSRQGIIAQLRFVNRHGLPADYVDTYVGNIMAVTPPQVQGMAEKYLVPDKMTLVVVGDKATVEPQVAPYKP